MSSSNLLSCNGVFIQSNTATATALQSIDRHHRNASHSSRTSAAASSVAVTSKSNKTTKKKKHNTMIWDKIQNDFFPELL